jgi:hypothetical protein
MTSQKDIPTSPLPTALRSPFVWSLVACAVLVFLFWESPLLQPLKWLTVLFHELSHAIAGWITGGKLISLNITDREGGICRVAGGNRTLILMAGYPGSLCWGLGALFLAYRSTLLKPSLYVLGALLAIVTLIYIRPVVGFGFLFGLLTSTFLIGLAHYGLQTAQRFAILLVGVCSCVYVMVDIQADVFSGGGGVSDATLLARHTGVPGLIWGAIWYVMSLLFIGFSLKGALLKSKAP